MRLADALATPDGKRRYVRTLFSTIANRYDLITVVLSYGQDQRWKRRLVDLVAPPGRRSGSRPPGQGLLPAKFNPPSFRATTVPQPLP